MKQSIFFLCFFFLDNKRKICKSNLVLEVVFVPESEGLYYLAVADSGKPPHPHPKGRKKIVWRPGPPPTLRVWMTAPPPPPPPYVKVCIRHCLV